MQKTHLLLLKLKNTASAQLCYTHTHTDPHTNTHTNTHRHTHQHTQTHTNTHKHTQTYRNTYRQLYVICVLQEIVKHLSIVWLAIWKPWVVKFDKSFQRLWVCCMQTEKRERERMRMRGRGRENERERERGKVIFIWHSVSCVVVGYLVHDVRVCVCACVCACVCVSAMCAGTIIMKCWQDKTMSSYFSLSLSPLSFSLFLSLLNSSWCLAQQ